MNIRNKRAKMIFRVDLAYIIKCMVYGENFHWGPVTLFLFLISKAVGALMLYKANYFSILNFNNCSGIVRTFRHNNNTLLSRGQLCSEECSEWTSVRHRPAQGHQQQPWRFRHQEEDEGRPRDQEVRHGNSVSTPRIRTHSEVVSVIMFLLNLYQL